jgi:RimJ/RimL family protein N-acetyltransferase
VSSALPSPPTGRRRTTTAKPSGSGPERLAEPGAAGWWLHHAVLIESELATVVGSVGYKGPPEGGVVEMRYSVAPSWQRRGLATEASRALVAQAWARGAEVVVAHALKHLTPSIGVLLKLGFEPTHSGKPDELEFALRRA